MKSGIQRLQTQAARGRSARTVLALLAGLLLLTSCTRGSLPVPISVPTPTPFLQVVAMPTSTPVPAQKPVTLRYALWDPQQKPAYAACAEQFMAAHPQITVVIEQTAWPEYWDKLADDLASNAAPDVFVNHLTRLPDLTAGGHLVDLEPLMQRDGLDDSIYLGRLARLWTRAGERFGLPKDWDTVALVYNQELLSAAGINAAQLNDLAWNPEDGGSFERMLARLTVDAGGNNALGPDFDAENVAVYGLTMADRDGGGAFGHQQWSYLAASNGFRFIDHLYATRYHYDDPALIETLAWYQRLIHQRGYHTPFEQIAQEGGRQLFLDGQAAMIVDGSWTISQYVNEAPFPLGFARLPIGPQGRQSMFNGLADSIWSGTEHPETAWEWVKYLGSVDCQLAVGEHAVTFPALQSGVERMLEHYEARGIDISAYVQQALEREGTFLFPVTENTSQVIAIMQPVIEAILRGEADPAVALPEANQRVNALFEP